MAVVTQENLLPVTGERMVSQLANEAGAREDVYDHLHRYGRAIDLVSGLDVLDIASGEGYGSYLLSQKAKGVKGVDISEETVEFASRKYKQANLEFLVGSADKIPLLDASIDVVVSFETLEHHDKHDEMMIEIKRVLRPGGLLIMSTPDIDTFKNKGGINHFHIKELNLNQFDALIKKYFTHYDMYVQRYVLGSLIVLKNSANYEVGFKEFQGNFDAITKNDNLEYPYYNICIASDGELPKKYDSIFHNYTEQTFTRFDLDKIVEHETYKVRKAIYGSREHKYGSVLARIYRYVVGLFK